MKGHDAAMPTFTNAPSRPAHLALGAAGEAEAARRLAARGFRILARNWRPAGPARSLELDIVAEHKGSLVFVEVKTRRNTDGQGSPDAPQSELGPRDNFTPAKRNRIIRAAKAYLQENGCWDRPCRFDLACITFIPGHPPALEHYAHVIEIDQPVGGGNTPWQPW